MTALAVRFSTFAAASIARSCARVRLTILREPLKIFFGPRLALPRLGFGWLFLGV